MTLSLKRQFGNLGEKLAGQFLMKRGFKVTAHNYLKPWGEIDIIATKNNEYHFIEVKSIAQKNVSHETRGSDSYRPEENVHPQKLKRIHRAIESYLMENNIDCEWQVDVVTVRIDQENKKARIEIIENIIGE